MKNAIKIIKRKDRKYVNILGINVTSTPKSGVLAGVEYKISHNNKFSILTPNSELVLMAQNNRELFNALNAADFAIPDTVGLKYATLFLYGRMLDVIPGRKFFWDLINLANQKKLKVFLLGGLDNEAELTASILTKKYKNIKVDYLGGREVPVELTVEVADKINKFAPDLLFVAFGNPKQEIWIHKNLAKLKVKGMMAVGGTFRYVSGLSSLPPRWMEMAGLEWLWRGLTEPYRIKRIINAVIVFPLRVFWSKVSGD